MIILRPPQRLRLRKKSAGVIEDRREAQLMQQGAIACVVFGDLRQMASEFGLAQAVARAKGPAFAGELIERNAQRVLLKVQLLPGQ